jgi:hypothetical protein
LEHGLSSVGKGPPLAGQPVRIEAADFTRPPWWQQQYRQAAAQAEQKARDAAEAARKAVSRAGLFGFVALVLGAVAAWFGGSRATPEREATLVGRLTRRF